MKFLPFVVDFRDKQTFCKLIYNCSKARVTILEQYSLRFEAFFNHIKRTLVGLLI